MILGTAIANICLKYWLSKKGCFSSPAKALILENNVSSASTAEIPCAIKVAQATPLTPQ